jgi:DNA-binding transcriptional MerR regulator
MEGLSIEELAQAADVPVRTVRYYISEGLLPGPGARGRAATYDDEHLARLRLVRRLVDQHVPLAEVRDRLAHLSAAEVESVLRTEQRRDAALRRADEASPREYISGLLSQLRRPPPPPPRPSKALPLMAFSADASEPPSWRRFELAPGIELHVRADALRNQAALVEHLIQISRTAQGR